MSEQRPVATGIMTPEQLGAGQAQTNPLGMFNTMSEVLLRNQQIQKGNLEIAARNRFGEIMGTGQGSIEDKFNQALTDPLASAWAVQNYGSIKQGMLAMIQANAEQNKMTTSAFNIGAQSLGTVTANPDITQEQYHNLVTSKLNMLDPTTRQNAALGLASIEAHLFDGNPSSAEKLTRAAALWMGSGGTPETVRSAMGLPPPSLTEVTTATGAKLPTIFSAPLNAPPSMISYTGPTATVGPQPGAAPGATAAPPAPPGPQPGVVPPAGGGLPQGTNAYGQTLLPGESAVAPQVAPQPIQFGQTTEQQKATESRVSADSKVRDDMADYNPRGDILGATRLNAMFDALKMVRTGGMIETGVAAGQRLEGLMRTIGVKPEVYQPVVNALAGGDQAAAQMLRHLITNQAIATLKESMTGTGRVMRPEVDKSLERLDLNMEPEAIFHILNDQTMPLIQMSYDMGVKWPQYEQAVNEGRMGGFGVRHFKSWEMGLSRGQRIQTSPDGINLGNRNIDEMLSGPAYAPTPATPPRTAPAPPTRPNLPPIRLTPPGQ